LIFDRKLMLGSGPNIYGLIVAKYLIKNKEFINTADAIKRSIMNEIDPNATSNSIPIKTSNYNNDLLMTNCYICNYRPTNINHKELETHHINFQSDCYENGQIKSKPYLHKNELYNLVTLCRPCHQKVHKNEIIIDGYTDTSIGPILNFKFNRDEQINQSLEFIKDF